MDISVLSLKGFCLSGEEHPHIKELLVFPAPQAAAAPDLPNPPWQQFSSQRSNAGTSWEDALWGCQLRSQGHPRRPRLTLAAPAQHWVAGDGAKSKNNQPLSASKDHRKRNFPMAPARQHVLV